MRLGWFTTFRSSFYALVLHIVAVGLLVVSLDLTPDPVLRPHQDINIVEAVSVDKSAVDREIEKLKQAEREKQEKEQERLAELEKKAEEMRRQRLEEEKKLAETRKIKEQERLEEQKRLTQLEKEKAELERQRKIEQEKKREAELERKRQEEARQKAEEEKRKAAEERRRLEEEKKRIEEEKQRAAEELEKKKAEDALQEQLAAEQAEERAAEQQRQDQKLLRNITNAIYLKVLNNFIKTGLPEGLSCELRIKLVPGGEVVGVSIINSSGNDIFDRRAVTAVEKSSPLPVPDDAETLDRLDLRDIKFTFKPRDY